jgi:hypothetical protein
MAEKEIELLQKQIDKLDVKDFELEGWKKYTIIVLARIFGEANEKINQIDKLEYEFSSWSLRDASGNESYEEGTKKLAREILQASIDELRVFGLPGQPEIEHDEETIQELLNLLLDELKGSQVKQLKTILASRESKDEKSRKIKEILEELGQYNAYKVLISMLLHPAAIKMIKGK